MALTCRRLSIVAFGATAAVLASLAGPIGSASAADPIVGDPAPSLVAPSDDPSGMTPLKDVVLRWTSVAHATSYQVQISPNGDWTNNTVTLPSGGKSVTTTYDVPLSLPHATYYWRVRGVDSGGQTAWSSSRTFLRSWVAPFHMLSTPSSSDPSLSWQPVAGASLYRVRFSTQPDFGAASTFSCETNQTSFTPYAVNSTPENMGGDCFDSSALTENTKYYWEVTAYDDSSAAAIVADTSNNSAWECATVQPECDTYRQPNVQDFPTLPSFTFQPPTAGSVAANATVTGMKTTWNSGTATANSCTSSTCPTTPTFSWDPVAGANYYQIVVWRDPTLSNVYRVYDTAYPHVTPRDAFFDAQAGTSYYWTVAPGTCQNSSSQPFCANSTDTAGSASSPQCATATTASTPSISSTGLSPTTVNAGQTTTVTLNGSNFAPGACVAASNGAGVISNINVASTSQITFQYQAPGTAQQVTFTVVNADGGTSNPSPGLQVVGESSKVQLQSATFPAATFEKATDPVTLSSPSNGGVSASGPLTFVWNDFLTTGGHGAYDVRNYRLQVAKDASFDNVVWDLSNIDMTQFTNPTATLPAGVYYWRIQPIDESGNHLTWSSTWHFTRDATPPVFTIIDANSLPVTANLHVKASETDLVGTVSQSTLHVVTVAGGAVTVPGSWAQTAAGAWTFNPTYKLVSGQSYALRVVGGLSDAAGNAAVASSRTVRATTLVDDKSSAWSFSSGWSRHASSNALHGTYVTARGGHTATVTLVGSKISVYGCKSPSFGKLVVQLDGSTKAIVSEHQGFTQCGVLLWHGSVSSTAVHHLRLVTSGTASIDEVALS